VKERYRCPRRDCLGSITLPRLPRRPRRPPVVLACSKGCRLTEKEQAVIRADARVRRACALPTGAVVALNKLSTPHLHKLSIAAMRRRG